MKLTGKKSNANKACQKKRCKDIAEEAMVAVAAATLAAQATGVDTAVVVVTGVDTAEDAVSCYCCNRVLN